MIAGKFTCPKCSAHFELNAVSAPAQQAQRSAPAGDVSDEVDRLLKEITEAVMFGAALDDKAMTFYRETQARYEEWGDRIKMSEKQMSFLRSVAARAGVD